MGEVEAQPVGRNQRALLRHVIAQHLAQRLVQKVRGRMISPDAATAGMIDFQRERGADFERALLDGSRMDEHVARLLLGVGDGKVHAVAAHDAGVADLTAGLGVKRRLVEDDGAALPGPQRIDLLAVLHQRDNDALVGFGLVAQELARAGFFAQAEPDRLGGGVARAGPGGARLLALALHGGVEAFGIDGDAARLERVLGEVEWKPVGVVERKGGFAGKLGAAPQILASLLEQREPALKRLAKPRLFELERFGDQRFGAGKLGIGLAHLAHERGNEAPHQRVLRAEELRMAHGAAHDAAEHVAAALVRRQHPVGDQERRRAQVIGDDAVGYAARIFGLDPGQVGDVGDDGAE